MDDSRFTDPPSPFEARTDRAAHIEAPRPPHVRADPRPELELDEPLEDVALVPVADALLKAPGRVLATLRSTPGAELHLVAIALATLAVTGVVAATFSGGAQLLIVPLKLTLGTLVCAAVCLPSLHVFSCLSGAEQSVRQTAGALLMGVALMGILLVGFAPVLWIFGQATRSVALMGALHLGFFLVSVGFGLGLSRRALRAMNRAPVRASGLWSVMFVCVLLQMATTLRPLVGPFEGVLFHDRMFFLAHWAEALTT